MQNNWHNFSSTSISQSGTKLSSPFAWRFSLVYAAILLCCPPTFADSIKTSLLKKPNKCLGRPKLAANTTSHVHIFVDGERHHNKNNRLCGTGKYAIFGNRQVGDMMSLFSASRSFIELSAPPPRMWDRPNLLVQNNVALFSQIMALMLGKSGNRVVSGQVDSCAQGSAGILWGPWHQALGHCLDGTDSCWGGRERGFSASTIHTFFLCPPQ